MIASESEPAENWSPAAPPTWSLPLALVFVVATLLPFLVEYRDPSAIRRFGHEPGRPHVAAIGNSLLKTATGVDGGVEVVARNRGLGLVWARVCRAGWSWDFEAGLERLVVARPDLLLVADNVLFYPPLESWIESFASDTRSRVHRFLSREGPPLLVREPPQYGVRAPAPVGASEVAAGPSTFPHLDFRPLGGRVLELLQRAQTQGTQVVVLVLPRSVIGRTTAAERTRIEQTLERLPGDEGIAVWRCPLEFADGDFFDGSHLSETGSHRYVAWLVSMTDAWWRKQARR